MNKQGMRTITISVQEADALTFQADVLALKHAQALYGVDEDVVNILSVKGQQFLGIIPPSAFKIFYTKNRMGVRKVLFLGVKPLRQFGYPEIREFGRRVLTSLAGAMPDAKHISLTIHGPGFGLDEIESFEAELAGLLDAISSGDFPEELQNITFIERNQGRADRLIKSLNQLIPNNTVFLDNKGNIGSLGEKSSEQLRSVGYISSSKPNIFVAMPFSEDMDDLFHYGIQGAVNVAGFLCERADLSTFTGDVMEWVKKRISTSSLVIADLSKANPNVYLEVGYAWGCNKPTVLLVKDTNELKFDVQGQRCIKYKNIKNLEESLTKELSSLKIS